MRHVANAFLILFFITALLTLCNEVSLWFDFSIFQQLPIQLFFWITAILAMVLYFAYGLNRRLPIRILLPAQLWLVWSLIDYWPLELAFGSLHSVFAAATQLILALILFQSNRIINGQSRLLTRAQYGGSGLDGGRLFKFFLINIPLLPILLLILLFSLTSSVVEKSTAGFVHLKPNGIYMTEKTYFRNGKQIQLIGMIHLARDQFYNDLNAAVPPRNTLILLEGVKDSKRLLDTGFNYGKIADILGLTSQRDNHFQGRLINETILKSRPKAAGSEIDMLPADIDLKKFDPQTIKVLNALARYVLSAEKPLAGYLEFSRWAQDNMDDDTNSLIMNDLLGKRNKHLLSYLPSALRRYDNLVIPWGALHMKELEQELIDREYELTGSTERLSVDFFSLPFAQIWSNLGIQ